MKTGIYLHMPAADYHRDDALSHSRLKKMDPTPAHFRAALDKPPEKPTWDMLIGTMTHSLVTEGQVDMPIVVTPDTYPSKSTKGRSDEKTVIREDKPWHMGATYCKAWVAEQEKAGRIPLDKEGWETALGCARAVIAHPEAGRILKGAVLEPSCFLTACGAPVKFRPDILPDGNFIADIKTVPALCGGRDAFASHAWDRGYFTQAAWYLDMLEDLTMTPDDQLEAPPGLMEFIGLREQFVFIVVEKAPPYAVALYEVGEDTLAKAREINTARFEAFRRCVQSGEWPAYPSGIQTIDAPRWALRKEAA
jgi:PDDEXK-like domain of unknown function (DUF3799)